MKLQFKATATGPLAHSISAETINGIDLSPLEHGGAFLGSEATRAAGIRNAWRDAGGELHVTLTERTIASRIPGRKAHWRGDGTEIDAAAYDPATCHVVPTGFADLAEGQDYRIAWREGVGAGEAGWTIESVAQGDTENA